LLHCVLVASAVWLAPYKNFITGYIIHYGDKIDSSLFWYPWQDYGEFVTLSDILTTRNIDQRFYCDSTGYIGLRHRTNMGWFKLKLEGCNKIILYESLIK